MEQFHDYQNKHSQAWYIFLTTSRYVPYMMTNQTLTSLTCRWFQLRVDLLSVIYISVTQFTSIPLAKSEKDPLNKCIYILYLGLNPALVALSLAYVVALTDLFSFTLRLSTEIENLVKSSG